MAVFDFPEKAGFLFHPAPYKIMLGGRGGSKSWDVARALLMLGRKKKLRILCCREIQRSIKESVHKLLELQSANLGLAWFYTTAKDKIVGQNGTEFIFAGLRHNISEIKSMEGIDICWVEEAHLVSDSSWEILIPTIRLDPPHGPFELGSEIWVTFNPELRTDPTYKRFVLTPPAGAVVVEVNWRDNPWFPEILRKQKDDMRDKNPDRYMTVWEGQCAQVLEGSIYANELREATEKKRISPHIVVDRSKPVCVSFDLGRADICAIWFIQQIGMLHNCVDYYENCGHDFAHYLNEIQSRKYNIGTMYLPHDARHHHQSAHKSIETQAREFYPGDNKVMVNKPIEPVFGINCVRNLFPRLYFNEQLCDPGLHALRHYRYKVDPETKQRTRLPLHDFASHGADALEAYAVGIYEEGSVTIGQPVRPPRTPRFKSQAWMNN